MSTVPMIWSALAVIALATLLLALLKTAFRGLGRVAAQGLAQKDETAAFLRKSLHQPTPLWYSLQIGSLLSASAFTLLAYAAANLSLEARPLVAAVAALATTMAVALLFEHVLAPLVVQDREEATILRLLGLLRLVHYLFMPMSIPLASISDWGGWTGGERNDAEQRSEQEEQEDIQAFIEMGEHEGILEEQEKVLVKGVMDFGDAVLHEVMTPRTEVDAVETGIPLGELRHKMAQTMFTRLPVFEGSLDTIRGIVHLKDLLKALDEGLEEESVETILRPVYHAPESMRVHDLLRLFQAQRLSMAVVVDEYGGTAGIVTMEDLIEEIVGEIQDEHETEEAWVVREGSGSYTVDGRAELDHLAEILQIDLDSGGVETVGGLVFSRTGYLPKPGEVVEIDDHRFTVLEADEKRIYRLRIEPAATSTVEQEANRGEE